MTRHLQVGPQGSGICSRVLDQAARCREGVLCCCIKKPLRLESALSAARILRKAGVGPRQTRTEIKVHRDFVSGLTFLVTG